MNKVCPICQKNKNRVEYVLGEFTLYYCFNCQVRFIYPKPIISKIMKNNDTKYNALDTERAYFSKKEELYRRARECVKHLVKYKKSGKLLDIGCSYGFYLDVFRQAGYDVQGLELTKRAIKYAKSHLRLNVVEKDLNSYSGTKSKFEIITLYDVIEHLEDPVESLHKIHTLLKPGGVLVVQTPNFNSVISKLTRTKWFWLLIPQHLFLFNKRSIIYTLQSNGFHVSKLETWDDTDEFINNILFVLHLKDKGKTKHVYFSLKKLFELFTPIFKIFSKMDLGGELIVYAKKK